MGESITIRRTSGPTRNEYGRTITAAVTETVVENCLVAPGTSAETYGIAREGAEIAKLVFAPKGTVVEHLDEVDLADGRYQVSAPPAVWDAYDGGHCGVVIPLNKTKG